ncbi:MAG: glycosyltransferase [Crocinitomicaceae bacterium]|nr:glycosyltransferase [Crocinitomicaceae bacterium]
MKKERKKTLFLSYDGLTDPLGQSQVIPYIIGVNETQKYSITIISFEKNKNYLENEAKIKTILLANEIDWIALKYTKFPPIISTLWDVFKLQKTVNLLIKEGVALIHCRSYITSLVALKIKRKKNIPFIFDMRGFYADERVDGGLWNKNHFLFKRVYNFFKKKERAFCQESNHIISLTSSGKKEMESWKLKKLSPISVIPCCTDEKLFDPNNIKKLSKKLDVKDDDFVLSYVGSVGTWYMLDEMLDFFIVLQKKKSNAKFLFITKDNPNNIYVKAKEKGIDTNSILIQPSPRELMPSYISLSHFSIFFILPVFSKKASSPTKMGEIMSLGVPVICNKGVGDVDEIMNLCLPNLLVKSFENKEYNKIADLVLSKPTFNRDKIIETSKNYYSLDSGIKKYQAVYESILN